MPMIIKCIKCGHRMDYDFGLNKWVCRECGHSFSAK